MLRMVAESSTTRTQLGSRTRIERLTSRRASSGRPGLSAVASVSNGSATRRRSLSRTVNGGLRIARAAATVALDLIA